MDTSSSQPMANITLVRRDGLAGGGITGWDVLLDNSAAGVIGSSETKSFTVPPGKHSVQLKNITYPTKSNAVELEVTDGETVNLECGTRASYALKNVAVTMVVLTISWWLQHTFSLPQWAFYLLLLGGYGLYIMIDIKRPGGQIYLRPQQKQD